MLLAEHHEAIEVDLLRYYGVDVLDWWRGTLSGRRLMVLINALPATSATVQEIGGPASQWGVVEHRLTDLVDILIAVNRDPKRPAPAPLPRPGDAQRADTARTRHEQMLWEQAQKVIEQKTRTGKDTA